MSARFLFGSFELDPVRHRLSSAGEPVAASDRQLDVLALLLVRAGQVVAKDDLIQAGWHDVAVSDNSLEQAISSLRRLLGEGPDGVPLIETVPRRGYRFTGAVQRTADREDDRTLDALLAPHRAFLEGRAALETLSAQGVARARAVFQEALALAADHPSAHLGLANACVMQFEMTRTDAVPDVEALRLAVAHARDACRLDPQSAEAWATLGFVLDRAQERQDAQAAVRRAVALEPSNWRHHFRRALVAWGEERLSAAQKTLTLLPDFPLAHWLAATVYVARQAIDEAERELRAGLAGEEQRARGGVRFSSVALHWLLGLILLERGDERGALAEFERELATEGAGHLYARECAANTWYAIGALRLRQGRAADAEAAFKEALTRVAVHPLAQAGLSAVRAAVGRTPAAGAEVETQMVPRGFEGILMLGAALTLAGDHETAARTIDRALTDAPPGPTGWQLPIEPLLQISTRPSAWSGVLARLRNRAA